MPYWTAWAPSCMSTFFFFFSHFEPLFHSEKKKQISTPHAPPFLLWELSPSLHAPFSGRHTAVSQRLDSSTWRMFLFMVDYMLVSFILDFWLQRKKKKIEREDRHKPGGSELFSWWTAADNKTAVTVTATEWPKRHSVLHTLVIIVQWRTVEQML